MPALIAPPTLGDLLKYEAPNLYSREAVIVAAGQHLVPGTVLGRRADGRCVALDPVLEDGAGEAFAVLITAADATLAECDAVAVVRQAIVSRSALVWPEGLGAERLARALARLDALGIVVRDGA